MLIQPGDIAKLSSLRLLKRLHISCSSEQNPTKPDVILSRDDLTTIGRFPLLEELHLSSSLFNVDDFQILQSLTNLTEMDIPCVVVRAHASGLLTSFKKLQKLYSEEEKKKERKKESRFPCIVTYSLYTLLALGVAAFLSLLFFIFRSTCQTFSLSMFPIMFRDRMNGLEFLETLPI